MNWLAKMQYRYGRRAPKNLMLVVAGGQIVAWLAIMLFYGGLYEKLQLTRAGLAHLELWRLVTFVFSPSLTTNPLFFALEVYLIYMIGTSLERAWGAFTFDVYFLIGMAGAWVACLLTGYGSTSSLYYSLFFAFAWLYPDMQLLLFFVLPVKVKWLAWIDAALFAFDFFFSIFSRQWITAVLPLVAILNYLIFFWEDLMGIVRRTGQRAAYRTNPQTINFKKAQKQVREHKGYLHKCAVCGITDADDPNMEFRYCSKCNGYYCYCMKHINDHVHVQ